MPSSLKHLHGLWETAWTPEEKMCKVKVKTLYDNIKNLAFPTRGDKEIGERAACDAINRWLEGISANNHGV